MADTDYQPIIGPPLLGTWKNEGKM